jgi:predicted DNA-binding protein (MmcQ/YjbR family)
LNVAPPAIIDRTAFERLVLSNQGTVIVHQWGNCSVAKIGPKIYCLLTGDDDEIWFKVSDMAFDLLPELPSCRPAPHFARAKWVAISPGHPLSSEEIGAYLAEAHRLVALKLTRKVRAELGLGDK